MLCSKVQTGSPQLESTLASTSGRGHGKADMKRDSTPLRIDTASSRDPKLTIRVLLYHSAESMWIAQGLERSMVAHGPTPEAAMAAIHNVLQLRVNFDCLNKRKPLSQLAKA